MNDNGSELMEEEKEVPGFWAWFFGGIKSRFERVINFIRGIDRQSFSISPTSQIAFSFLYIMLVPMIYGVNFIEGGIVTKLWISICFLILEITLFLSLAHGWYRHEKKKGYLDNER